jgi:protocatechuate 3,4-dioxygenase beta subunit
MQSLVPVEVFMDRDDSPVGHVLTRRETLAFLGASGLAFLGGLTPPSLGAARPRRAIPGCVVRPAQTEGPYFVDEKLNRSDIRSDPKTGTVKNGTALALVLAVSGFRDGACAPLAGAHVDIWHCDAQGVYSDVKDPSFDTVGQRFLRGYQITNAAGEAQFQTIYPGWYSGRTVHIHFKVRTDPGARNGHEFTSQLYFDDALTTRVHSRPPYAAQGQRRDRNADDRIFTQGGDQLILAPAPERDGYLARFAVGLQMS